MEWTIILLLFDNFSRPHRYNNCRLSHPNSKMLHPQRSANQIRTDYQTAFKNFHPAERSHPIRPVENPIHLGDLPGMDFRTENHESFKRFGEVGKLRPCKVWDFKQLQYFSNNKMIKNVYRGYILLFLLHAHILDKIHFLFL